MLARRGKVESVTWTNGVCVRKIPEGLWRPTERLLHGVVNHAQHERDYDGNDERDYTMFHE